MSSRKTRKEIGRIAKTALESTAKGLLEHVDAVVVKMLYLIEQDAKVGFSSGTYDINPILKANLKTELDVVRFNTSGFNQEVKSELSKLGFTIRTKQSDFTIEWGLG